MENRFNWFYGIGIIIASIWGFSCMATKPTSAPIETVGTLTPSYHSIAVAPTHGTTDLAPTAIVDSSKDSAVKAAPKQDESGPETVEKNAHGF